MRIYLAGGMRGYPHFNFPAFFQAEAMLIKEGHKVFNPARRDIEKHGEGIANRLGDIKKATKAGFSLRDALADDTQWLCKKADAIALLPGWRKSKGATAEHALAVALGLQIIFLKKGQ